MNLKQLAMTIMMSLVALAAGAADYEVTGSMNAKIFTIDLKEKEATAAGCDLFVRKFEYYPDFKFMNLIVAEVKECPMDSIAARKAHFDWNMPFNFANQKSIYLKINGRFAGTLMIENQQVTFKPRGN